MGGCYKINNFCQFSQICSTCRFYNYVIFFPQALSNLLLQQWISESVPDHHSWVVPGGGHQLDHGHLAGGERVVYSGGRGGWVISVWISGDDKRMTTSYVWILLILMLNFLITNWKYSLVFWSPNTPLCGWNIRLINRVISFHFNTPSTYKKRKKWCSQNVPLVVNERLRPNNEHKSDYIIFNNTCFIQPQMKIN